MAQRILKPESFIVKLLEVPVELSLYNIVDALKGDLKSIISIYRIYDYINHQRCNEVVIIVRDIFEYKEFRERQHFVIGLNEIQLLFDDWYFGAASRSTSILNIGEPTLSLSPISLKLSNLTEVSRVTSFYLIKLLTAFESWDSNGVTGISLSYDGWRDAIRPFGFIAFKDLRTMMIFHSQQVRIFDEFINCEASTRVPILLNASDKELLVESPAMFTEELCNFNILSKTSLVRDESQLSLAERIEAIHINQSDDGNDIVVAAEPIVESMQCISDSESILSIDLHYDFDDDMNIVERI
ncbi:hypothetical protein ACKWTF_016829 [Chironomus riparius]